MMMTTTIKTQKRRVVQRVAVVAEGRRLAVAARVVAAAVAVAVAAAQRWNEVTLGLREAIDLAIAGRTMTLAVCQRQCVVRCGQMTAQSVARLVRRRQCQFRNSLAVTRATTLQTTRPPETM
jgi:hypothetical protein